MGNSATRQNHVEDSLAEPLVSNVPLNPQMQEQTGCCCFGSRQQSRLQNNSLNIWKNDFIDCCKNLSQECQWSNAIIKSSSQPDQQRIDNMKDFSDLKNQFARLCRDHELPRQIEMKQIIHNSPVLENDELSKQERNSLKAFTLNSSFKNRPKSYHAPKMSLFISVINENMKALYTPHKMEESYKESIYFFIEFTELVEKHSRNANSVLGKVLMSFATWLQNKFSMYTQTTQNIQDILIMNVNSFVELYSILINLYYNILSLSDDSRVKCSFSFDNIKSAASTILFKTSNFYEAVFKIISLQNMKNSSILQEIITVRSSLQPQNMDIAHEYCLNQLTLQQYLLKGSVSQDVENVNIEVVQECSPYQHSIEKLKQILVAQTPISKLKVIISVAHKISESINKFNKLNHIVSDEMVDSDQILSIFIFIIVKSGISDLGAHLKFIENFCTEEQLMSETGYYTKVAEGALKALVMSNQEMEEDY